MQVWNVLHAARWKYSTQKNRHFGTIAQICRAISSELRHVSTIGKKLVTQQSSSTCPGNMVNFGLLTAEIFWRVWGTPTNLNGFHVLAPLLHGTPAVGVSQTLRRWTEGAICSAGRPSRWASAHILVYLTFNFYIQSTLNCIIVMVANAKILDSLRRRRRLSNIFG